MRGNNKRERKTARFAKIFPISVPACRQGVCETRDTPHLAEYNHVPAHFEVPDTKRLQNLPPTRDGGPLAREISERPSLANWD